MSDKKKSPQGYVGFANLPNQVHRKATKKGFEFTVMVVGESGLGKSTLINSLFLTDMYETRDYPPAQERIQKTVRVEATTNEIEEKGVRLRLTIVDTPGFGDAVDNTDSWAPILNFIDDKYEEFLNAESRVNRKKHSDDRVHVCLYFISATCHGLKPLDIEFMRQLQHKVNLIPVIAKSDTLTPEEVKEFKLRVLDDIDEAGIRIYHSQIDSEDDEETVEENTALEGAMPFAVCGSTDIIEVGGKQIRGRQYPWGIVEVENETHSDFSLLRSMLIRTHMQDLKDSTHDIHYENFRAARLSSMGGFEEGDDDVNPMTKFEEEKKNHVDKMERMEEEMRQVFQMKVKEKEKKLKESEQDLMRRHEEMARQLAEQKRELETKQRELEEARLAAASAPDKKGRKSQSRKF